MDIQAGDVVITKGGSRLAIERVMGGRVYWRDLTTGAVGVAGVKSTVSRIVKIMSRKQLGASMTDHNKMLIDRVKGAPPARPNRFSELDPQNPNASKASNDNGK